MVSPDENNLMDLAGAAYEAALDSALWLDVAERLRAAFGAMSASVTGFDFGRMQGFVMNAGSDPAMIDSYIGHFVKMDPTLPKLMRLTDSGRSFTRAALMPQSAIMRTEFYADWMRPQGIWHGLMAVASCDETLTFGVSINRERRQGEFDADAGAALETLLPHFARAVRTTCRLAAAEARGAGVEGLLARLQDGAMLLKSNGAVLYANPAAEALLRGGDGLATAQGILRATFPGDDAALRRMMAAAASSGGGTLAVARPSGRAPLAVAVQPASTERLSASDPWRIMPMPAMLVFVIDPNKNQDSGALTPMLRSLYGLTAKEAVVAETIAKGQGVADMADALGMAPSTLRWHLQSVFEKTGTARQAELARLVERLGFVAGPCI